RVEARDDGGAWASGWRAKRASPRPTPQTRHRLRGGRVADQRQHQVVAVRCFIAGDTDTYVRIEIAHLLDHRVIRRAVADWMDDDSAYARAGQVSNCSGSVRRLGHDRDARREQPFLRASADARDYYLAAVAFDLVIGQPHKLAMFRISWPCSGRTGRNAGRDERGALGVRLLDDVLFDRLDRDAALAQPRKRAFDLLVRSLELDRNQAHLFRDARAADVEHQVELL